ncbi:MAG: class I SAM-dependent methyltransferase [Candidatus Paceibacterota bacterium]|jgi:FkbM family methyltransferase
MKIFLDIGAWKGDTAKSVLTSKHDFDKIYCFEPQLDLCDAIRSLNNPKIKIEEFGLWNKTCAVPLYMEANSKSRKATIGATVYEDKFSGPKKLPNGNMMKASDWFCANLNADDYIVMKMNCEGAECDILEDLMDSGEFDKVDVLMVDFDVRKIPSQKHRQFELQERLKAYKIPIYTVGRVDRFRLKGIDKTHYWMDTILVGEVPRFDKASDDKSNFYKNIKDIALVDEEIKPPVMNAFEHRDTLEYIAKKYNFDFSKESPFHITGGRNGLAVLFNELGFSVGAEIGVQSGNYSEVLCKAIPTLKLYGVDAWTKYEGYNDVQGEQERYDRIYEQAKNKLAPYNCQLIKKWSMDAVKDFDDKSLDFVYLDGNHDFAHVTEDIKAWEKKIKPGGILAGHDFLRSNRWHLMIHVQDVVQAWTSAYQIKPWFVVDGDEQCPSWMYVK